MSRGSGGAAGSPTRPAPRVDAGTPDRDPSPPPSAAAFDLATVDLAAVARRGARRSPP